jgi:hypothetical protein
MHTVLYDTMDISFIHAARSALLLHDLSLRHEKQPCMMHDAWLQGSHHRQQQARMSHVCWCGGWLTLAARPPAPPANCCGITECIIAAPTARGKASPPACADMPTKGQYTRVHDEDEDEFAQLARDRSPPPPGTSPSDDDDSEPRGGRQNSNPLSVVESPQPINQTEQALRDEIARLRHENAELREKKAAQGANPEDAEAGGTTADSDDGKDQPQNQGRVTELGLLPDGTRINHKLVLATVSLNAILVMSCNTMFLPALNTVQMDLNTTTTMAALCLTVYTMGSAIQPLVMGPISDVIGRRKPMLVAHW